MIDESDNDKTDLDIESARSVYVIDLDGVLADFILEFTSLANRLFGTQVISTHSQKVWDIHDILTDEQREKTWEAVDVSDGFWIGVKPLATWPEMELLHSLQHDDMSTVHFLTARNLGVNLQKQTEIGLGGNGLCSTSVILIGDKTKGQWAKELGVTVAIDDRPETCDEYVAAGVPNIYLMRRLYNQPYDNPKVITIGCMMEFCWYEYKRREAEFAGRGIVDGKPTDNDDTSGGGHEPGAERR